MQVVNVRELKAKLSAYLRAVDRGETFLVTDRNRVVAKLGPLQEQGPVDELGARLAALGARPPLRSRRAGDYRRQGGPALAAERIDALLDWMRDERRT